MFDISAIESEMNAVLSSGSNLEKFLKSKNINKEAIAVILDIYATNYGNSFSNQVEFILRNLLPKVEPMKSKNSGSELRLTMEAFSKFYLGKTHLIVALLLAGYEVLMDNKGTCSHYFITNYPCRRVTNMLLNGHIYPRQHPAYGSRTRIAKLKPLQILNKIGE